MATRPWVTPQEVREYTENPRVKERTDAKLTIDIFRSEQHVIRYTNNRFEDPEKYGEIPQPVKIAVILLTEMYAASSSDTDVNSGKYKSESYDDYSYTIADTETKKENIDLGPLLDEYVMAAVRNGVNMKLRKL